MARQQAPAKEMKEAAKGWAALAGLAVVILGLTWPLVAFYDEGPRAIRFNCATEVISAK
jgi:hypothetical protein